MKLPKSFKQYFWDVDFEKLDLDFFTEKEFPKEAIRLAKSKLK